MVRIHVGKVEADQFGDPEPGSIQEFENREIAAAERGARIGRAEQGLDLLHFHPGRDSPGRSWRLQGSRGIRLHYLRPGEIPVERTKRGQLARDRRVGEAAFVKRAEVGAENRGIHVVRTSGTLPGCRLRFEEVGEPVEIGPVAPDSVGGGAPALFEIFQKILNQRAERRCRGHGGCAGSGDHRFFGAEGSLVGARERAPRLAAAWRFVARLPFFAGRG